MLPTSTPDDFGATTSAFPICSFWWGRSAGDVGRSGNRAVTIFERLLTYANPVGLFSEDIDPATGRLLGNFPQHTRTWTDPRGDTIESCSSEGRRFQGMVVRAWGLSLNPEPDQYPQERVDCPPDDGAGTARATARRGPRECAINRSGVSDANASSSVIVVANVDGAIAAKRLARRLQRGALVHPRRRQDRDGKRAVQPARPLQRLHRFQDPRACLAAVARVPVVHSQREQLVLDRDAVVAARLG